MNYDLEKLETVWRNAQALQRGTELHALACDCITHSLRVASSKNTLNRYINDAIGFHMEPEVLLYYSDNCYGWADALAYDEKRNKLRIHDLKTGESPTHMEQLIGYAALFCLMMKRKPEELDIELRIYQSGDVRIAHPDPMDIRQVMDTIVQFDRHIEKLKAKG